MHGDFGWVRKWFPFNDAIPAADGYLADDVGLTGLTLDLVRNIPCLVLLGAPGMGKSREAEATVHALRTQGEAADLIAVGRRADPLKSLLDLLRDPNAEAWRTSGARWHLFIDGIDEAFGAAAGFEASLRAFLNTLASAGGDLAKMRLRVLCRTVEWTSALDRLLEQFWSETEIRKLQIAPLSVADVRRAVDSITGDTAAADRFLARIDMIGAAALASRPVSLVMLAELQREHGELPAKQAELYRLGLEELVDEPNESRRLRPRRGALNPTEALAVAARIAAATALSGKTTIWLGPGPPPDLKDAFALREIDGGVEPAGLASFRVAEADLVDAVRSPLFAQVTADSYVWVHQTFMEYLAARYLVDHDLTAEQILELLAVPDPQGARRTAPQWREIAAWAATLSKPFFDLLIANEPDVLLQSDVAAADDADRKQLVAALLDRLDAGELVEIISGLRSLFSRLDHPGLADQLREALFSSDRSDWARRTAIDIAEETHLAGLAADFARLALAGDVPLQVRVDAAYAVPRVGDEAAKALLAPLLRGDLTFDDNDELRGAALRALWPNHLTLAEMLGALTPERRSNLIGAYHMFLRQLELPALSPDEALDALRWLDGLALDEAHEDGLEHAITTVFWAAIAQAADERVLGALAAFLRKIVDSSSDWILDQRREGALRWPTDPAIRLAIALRILQASEDPETTARVLLYILSGLLNFEDLEVCLAALRAEDDPKVQAGLTGLVISLSAGHPVDELVAVFNAADTLPQLAFALQHLFSVDLESSTAKWARESAEREKKQAAKIAEREKDAERADARARELLAAIDASDVDAWWHLNLQLFVSTSGRYEGSYEFQSDLTATPGWARLLEADRERVIDGAVRYLTSGTLIGQRWLGANTHYRPAAAAFRAFRLLFEQRPKAFAALPNIAWRHWAPAVLGFFDNDYAGPDGQQVAILKVAYRRAPTSVLGAVARMAMGPKSQGLSHRALLLLETIYDRRIGDLLDRLRRRKAFKSQEVEGGVWGFLARMAYPPALQDLRDALADIQQPETGTPPHDTVARATAERLAANDFVTWEAVQRLDTSRPDLARAIWSTYASSGITRRDGDAPDLPADLMASVYLDLQRLFPDRPGDEESGARFLQAIDYVEQLERGLLNRLVNRGTIDSIAAVARLQRELPDASWLGYRLQEARRAYRAAARRLYAPNEVIAKIEAMTPVRPLRDEVKATKAALALEVPPAPEETVVPDSPKMPSPGTALDAGAPEPARRLKLLLLASEWRSGHGGISTVNRDLCIAMAEGGHDVVCVALEASTEDQIAAQKHGVRLLRCPSPPGLHGRARFLALRRRHLEGFQPDVVFGHDHINGAEALQLSETFSALFVHVLHTVPQDSEIYKDRVGEGTRDPAHGYEKAKSQREIARAAHLVVGIGPKITDEAGLALGSAASIHELQPGLSADLLDYAPDLGRLRLFRGLLSARMADAVPKGAELACEAMRRAADRYQGPRPKLVLRGFTKGQGDVEFEQFARIATYRPVVELRDYTENTDELRHDLETSSLVLMPSLSEGFGLSAFEAIAAGIPVLLTLESGLAQLLMRLAAEGLVDQLDCDACILPVHSAASKLNFDGWADKIGEAVADLGKALIRAEGLRTSLRPLLTWRRAADGLTAAILKVLDEREEKGRH